MSTGAHVEMAECFYLASVGAGGRLVLIMRNNNMNVLTLKSNDQISINKTGITLLLICSVEDCLLFINLKTATGPRKGKIYLNRLD